MDVKKVIQSQYLASLAMLKQAILKCPPQVWDDPRDRDKFWFVAYHALYYAHVYLKTPGREYVRWKKPNYGSPGAAMTKSQILEYLALVEQEIAGQIPHMNLDGSSGYAGLVPNKLELQIYNIRHIQQHAGELYQRLSGQDVQLGWASTRHGSGPAQARRGRRRHETASPRERKK